MWTHCDSSTTKLEQVSMGGLIYPQLCHNGFPMDGNNGGFWV